jgi:hypothetical protein
MIKPSYKAFFSCFVVLVLLPGCAGAQGTENAVVPAKESSASVSAERDSVLSLEAFYSIDSTKTYNQVKAEILREKAKLSTSGISEDSLGVWFCNKLVYGLIPYWYGTPWTFEGYTAVPKQGTIACGYFVSTTLLHMGVAVNRYKLAQQLPVHEAKTLAVGAEVSVFEGERTDLIIEQLDTGLQNGLYFLGFDQSHVGYLLREKEQLFVIHSNYMGAQRVTVERISESQAFASYLRFYVVPVSGNKELMKKWLLNEALTVIETP